MSDAPVVHKPGDGEAFWVLGGLYDVRVASSETGSMTVMEMTMPAGMGPPPHTHPGSETVYVVEGLVKYYIGDDSEGIDAGPGSLFHIPEGTLEHFEPTTKAKVLATYIPGGIEGFFAEAGEPAQSHELPPPPEGPPDVERLAAIAERYGMHIQAPTAV